VTSILTNTAGVVMTNSAKWAWYAPGNLGVQVVFASLRECVESAVEGRVVDDDALWEPR
jgi:predicted aconitase